MLSSTASNEAVFYVQKKTKKAVANFFKSGNSNVFTTQICGTTELTWRAKMQNLYPGKLCSQDVSEALRQRTSE